MLSSVRARTKIKALPSLQLENRRTKPKVLPSLQLKSVATKISPRAVSAVQLLLLVYKWLYEVNLTAAT